MSVNPIEKPYQTNETFSIEQITSVFKIRSLQPNVVDQIVVAIQTEGFYPDGHLILNRENGTIELIAGNHRYEAAKQAGLTTLPVVIYDNLTHDEKLRIARQSNNNAETIAKTSFVDDAEELVWKELKQEGMTQERLAEALGQGWSRDKIQKYHNLSKISKQAWQLVTTFTRNRHNDNNTSVTENVTVVTFSENLLRSFLPLRRKYQLLLVEAFTHPDKQKRITAGKFKTRAEGYRYRDEMLQEVFRHTGRLSYTLTKKGFQEILSGGYDATWKKYKTAKKQALKKQKPSIGSDSQEIQEEFPKKPKYYDKDWFLLPNNIQTLIQSLKEQAAIQLIHGDFYKEVKKLPDNFVDLILTDPPYNVSYDREFVREDRSNLSRDFGDWDKYEHGDFIALFDVWMSEFNRILCPGGSGYIFASHRYMSYLEDAVEKADLTLREPVFWCKSNPAPQIHKITYRPTVECIIFFTKGGNHTFNWPDENDDEMYQHQIIPICLGDERRKDKEGKTLHPTQKPEQLIEYLMRNSSHQGNMVFDGFMGVGTVPAVAKRLRRHCIGIEKEKIFFEDAQRRVNDVKP